MDIGYRANIKQTWQSMSIRFKIGLLIVVAFLIIGFVVYQFSPGEVMTLSSYKKNQPPSVEHYLGTNKQGQDIFWLLIESIHNSMMIGIFVAFAATVIGVLIGLFAGFVGGIIDSVILFLCDSIIVIPSLPILILMGSLLKGRASLWMIGGILIIFNWPWPARQARSMALTIREREFINTARFSGESTFKIIRVEIVPHVLSWAMANFVNTILVAIGSEASLAVLGLSSTTTPTLGNMIYWARQYQAIMLKQWVWIGSPVLATSIMFIGLFLTYTGYNEYVAKKRGR
ncbi:MAG: ABC transporter permease [Christensenellales bacterium]|jgi:peptide/nickel transport system permease protein